MNNKKVYALSSQNGEITTMPFEDVENIIWDSEVSLFFFYYQNDGGTEAMTCRDYLLLPNIEVILEHGLE